MFNCKSIGGIHSPIESFPLNVLASFSLRGKGIVKFVLLWSENPRQYVSHCLTGKSARILSKSQPTLVDQLVPPMGMFFSLQRQKSRWAHFYFGQNKI